MSDHTMNWTAAMLAAEFPTAFNDQDNAKKNADRLLTATNITTTITLPSLGIGVISPIMKNKTLAAKRKLDTQ